MRRKKTQISKIRNKKGEITTNTKELQGIFRGHFENLYLNKLENLEEMDAFLDIYDHRKLNQECSNQLNRSITYNEIKVDIGNLPKKKSSGPVEFSAEFYKMFKEELITTLLKIFNETENEEILPSLFY
jgi:hypothetical protein